MAINEKLRQDGSWDPAMQSGNPCCMYSSPPFVEFYLTFTGEEQKRVGVSVNQADGILPHVVMDVVEGHALSFDNFQRCGLLRAGFRPDATWFPPLLHHGIAGPATAGSTGTDL